MNALMAEKSSAVGLFPVHFVMETSDTMSQFKNEYWQQIANICRVINKVCGVSTTCTAYVSRLMSLRFNGAWIDNYTCIFLDSQYDVLMQLQIMWLKGVASALYFLASDTISQFRIIKECICHIIL